jgi:hypothetical protein
MPLIGMSIAIRPEQELMIWHKPKETCRAEIIVSKLDANKLSDVPLIRPREPDK